MNYSTSSKHAFWGVVLGLIITTMAVVAQFPYANVTLICPETQPIPGNICAMPFAKGSCEYGEICCPGGDEEGGTTLCVPETYCSCSTDTVWHCDSVGSGALRCPSACPEIAPTRTDACDIPPLYQCAYNVCDSPPPPLLLLLPPPPQQCHLSYQQECYCSGGHFNCRSKTCPVNCPKTQPTNGDACSAPFRNDTCSYGLLCCPGKGGRKCISGHEMQVSG
jgi:hypothetical protein